MKIFEELRLLGYKKSIYRIVHEMLKKFAPYFYPINVKYSINLISLLKNQNIPFFTPNFSDPKILQSYRKLITPKQKKQIIKQANKVLKGKILCFGKSWANYGCPINWHKNPSKNISWPKNLHYSMIYSYGKLLGDIKFTWEVNRFPHVYLLVRAYLLTGKNKYLRAFLQHLKSWEADNPYRAGVNWANGQELAIRSLAWIWGFYTLSHSKLFTDKDFERLQRLLFLHATHIKKNINYARYAVHNNHLIGEALALYAIGSLFPHFPEARKWKSFGKKILEKDCLKQFYNDGGYCQNSHTYHRLAIHYYLWFCCIAKCNDDPIIKEVYEMLNGSAQFLASFMNLSDGSLNNWGCNDGALLCPWTTCNYTDFRPILSSLQYLNAEKRAFNKGPWEEELFFFFGSKSIDAPIKSFALHSRNFLNSGLHIMRNKKNTAIFRCGSIVDRFGQADQLHVDIRWKELNISIDGGSFLYNEQQKYHKYFMGTKSHNTITVNNQNQMYLHRPFKWLYWTKAKLLSSINSNNIMHGEHYGYLRINNVIHQRKITFIDNSYVVKDNLIAKKPGTHSYVLHWLITDYPFSILKKDNFTFELTLKTPHGAYLINIHSSHVVICNIFRAEKKSTRGWQSLFYGNKSKALSIEIMAEGENVYFISTFSSVLN